jgi:tyrosyl-tRNA synthetase
MPKKADAKTIEEVLSRGVDEVIHRSHLAADLKKGDLLRVKLGMDPTAPDLHLGHAVLLRKLREFQDLGHEVVLIIGDYTALIGDPSGRSKTRPPLEPAQIDKNAETYLVQAGKVLDLKKVEVHKNSEWLRKLSFADLLKLAANFTVARIIERDDFQKRLAGGVDVALHELLYPLMQAYDSVAIKASVELGGTDQRFNMLAGRELQKKIGQPEQDVMTCPLLVGLDGEKKMSKSLGNYIGLTEAPESMYGKTMSIPDRLIIHYFELATLVSQDEIGKISKTLVAGENPRNIKMRLAREIVTVYHGKAAATKAEEAFVRTFQKHETPEEMSTLRVDKKMPLHKIIVAAGFAKTASEAKRVIEEGGVKLDGTVVEDPNATLTKGAVLQKGKRFFAKIVIK